MSKSEQGTKWWQDEGGFYGEKYMLADNSVQASGYERVDLDTRTQQEVKSIENLTGIKPSSRILDIPCGYGRHTLALFAMGHNVVGIDLNKKHIEKAKVNAGDLGLNPVFLTGNMRELDPKLYDSFDLVINMFYSFGYFENEVDNLLTLKEFFKSLKPGGKLFLHIGVRPQTDSNGKHHYKDVRTLSNGASLLVERFYDSDTKRIRGEWTITETDGSKDKLTPYSVRTYDPDELSNMAEEVGFSKCGFYGSFQGEEFGSRSKDLIMVGTKNEI